MECEPRTNIDKIALSLIYFRITNKFTVKEVAKHLNICPTQYNMYESGQMYVTVPVLDILSQLYFVAVDDLLYPDSYKFNENILKTYKKKSKSLEHL